MSIAELRKKRGMTQKQLAEKVGVNYQWIQKIERGEINIQNITFIKGILLMKALYVDGEDEIVRENYDSAIIAYRALRDLLDQGQKQK